MSLDGKKIARACGSAEGPFKVHHSLCHSQTKLVEDAMEKLKEKKIFWLPQTVVFDALAETVSCPTFLFQHS